MHLDSTLKKAVLSNFNCQQTGNCCRASGVVYVAPDDMIGMAKILGLSVHEFVQNYTKTNRGWKVVADERFRPDCFLNSQNQCQVYASRPQACRTYPDWPDIWETDHSFKKEMLLCPALKAAYLLYKENGI